MRSSATTRAGGSRARFHTVRNARLFFYEEQPREVAALIDGFLRSDAGVSRPEESRPSYRQRTRCKPVARERGVVGIAGARGSTSF